MTGPSSPSEPDGTIAAERLQPSGFHDGESAVQERAGVSVEAARLRHMVEPAELGGGHARFLADRTFAVMTARDSEGILWTSPLAGPPGFLDVTSPLTLAIGTTPVPGDPLHGLAAGQPVGLIVIEPATRRRIRINGTLTHVDPWSMLVTVEQAYGNCPQYIRRRKLTFHRRAAVASPDVRRTTTLDSTAADLIRASDTFFLGTTHPERGNDASHRGGPMGFVHVVGNVLRWPDYPGNNMFNSLGNLAIDPTAAILFADFDTGQTLHLSGTATVEWGASLRPDEPAGTGRTVRFATYHAVAGTLLAARTSPPSND